MEEMNREELKKGLEALLKVKEVVLSRLVEEGRISRNIAALHYCAVRSAIALLDNRKPELQADFALLILARLEERYADIDAHYQAGLLAMVLKLFTHQKIAA